MLPLDGRAMRRFFGFAGLAALAAAGMCLPAPADAQGVSPLGGVWTLNRSLSEWPPEIGFNVNFIPAPGDSQGSGSSGGSRGRRGGGGGNRGSQGAFPIARQSFGDARSVQLLTAEARNPPVRLMIVDTPSAITITNELGQSRTLHPNGKEESLEIESAWFLLTTRRDGDRLVVVYSLAEGRSVRYTYAHSVSPSQLVVEVEFLGPGGGEKARRVYEPGVETGTVPPPSGAAAPESARQQPAEVFDQRPGIELRGLQGLGILVEDLSTQAVACGLNHDAIEAALSKRLTDAGFAVRRNSDEDTYVYVNVMTTTAASGTCVSRYDAFLYTHATANLSYRDRPVLVQVSLMHRGGLGSSAPSGHGAAVAHGLEGFIDLFITQIRDANK